MPSEEEKIYRELSIDRLKNSEERIRWLEDHYTTWNAEFGDVRADVRWLVKTYWVVVGASISSFVSAAMAAFLSFHK